MSQAPKAISTHDWQTTKSQNARLRKISRASLYLTGLVILLTYLPALAFMAEALAVIGVMTVLIAIGLRLRLWCVEFKRNG
jgi:hypothetical protein